MKLLFPAALFKLPLFSSVVSIDGTGSAVDGNEAVAAAATATASDDDDNASDDGARSASSKSDSDSSNKANKANESAEARGADANVADAGARDGASDGTDDGTNATLQFRALVYRLRDGPLVKMGICSVKYHKLKRLFTAYPENSPSTYNLVAKVPVPDDGKG